MNVYWCYLDVYNNIWPIPAQMHSAHSQHTQTLDLHTNAFKYCILVYKSISLYRQRHWCGKHSCEIVDIQGADQIQIRSTLTSASIIRAEGNLGDHVLKERWRRGSSVLIP